VRTPYEVALEARVGARSTYRFRTADGVHSKRSFRDAELLLAESLWDRDPGRLLCPEANYGVVGTLLSPVADAVTMTESSARAARLCERNARANDADAAVTLLADLRDLEGSFDAAAYAPRPYTPLGVGKRRAVDALAALRPGGRLYLAAAERAGLARYRDCLERVAGTVERIAVDGDCRLLAATRPRALDPPEYVTPRRLAASVAGVDLSLVTLPGLFSPSSVDDGTRLLLERTGVADGERVLDLCCGYGVVGAYAGRAAELDLHLTDDDRVATRCAECSLRASGVEATVHTADCTGAVEEEDRRFDRVLCNPPTHAGDGVLAELFSGAHRVLGAGGRLSVVHHRGLDLNDHLGRFRTVERHAGNEHVVLTLAP